MFSAKILARTVVSNQKVNTLRFDSLGAINGVLTLFKTRVLIVATLALMMASCAGPQPIKLSDWSLGLETEWIKINGFDLLLLEQPAKNNDINAIHIYIEGDGTPWVKRYLIARNPTPRYPLALALMKQDPQLSFYLGRPCYYQQPEFYKSLRHQKNPSPCNSHYWTDARYSTEVVSLMKDAIKEKVKQLSITNQSLPIILIGHSGGGTLAMLIAQELEAASGVITIAANMDIDAWTDQQGYSPLKNSINLARKIPLRKIPQVHFAGSADEVVPPKINMDLMQKMGRSLSVIEGFDHSCCWLDKWPVLLKEAEQNLKNQKYPPTVD